MSDYLIRDYASNVDNLEIDSIQYVEEYLSLNPTNSEIVDIVYMLYKARAKDSSIHYYIVVVSESSQMVIKGTEDVLKDIFPHIVNNV
jgi:outer membrane protein assembly factor BamD (BamD/ComL family)